MSTVKRVGNLLVEIVSAWGGDGDGSLRSWSLESRCSGEVIQRFRINKVRKEGQEGRDVHQQRRRSKIEVL